MRFKYLFFSLFFITLISSATIEETKINEISIEKDSFELIPSVLNGIDFISSKEIANYIYPTYADHYYYVITSPSIQKQTTLAVVKKDLDILEYELIDIDIEEETKQIEVFDDRLENKLNETKGFGSGVEEQKFKEVEFSKFSFSKRNANLSNSKVAILRVRTEPFKSGSFNPSISACGTISAGGTYTLTNNVSNNDSCFEIKVANVHLDCQGYSITGINNPAFAFQLNDNVPNTLIQHCNISNFNEAFRIWNHGINSNVTIRYNNISANTRLYDNYQSFNTIIEYNNHFLNISEPLGVGFWSNNGAGSIKHNIFYTNVVAIIFGINSNFTVVNNSIRAPIWVESYSTNSFFNDSQIGNIYYFANGTPSWEVYNLTSSTNSNWADGGDDYPFSSSTVAEWIGTGTDWHPYVQMTQNPTITPNTAYTDTELYFNVTFNIYRYPLDKIDTIKYTIYLNDTPYLTSQKTGTFFNEDDINLHNESGFEKDSRLILEVQSRYTNGTWLEKTNSTEVIIKNYAPTITNLSFSQNGASFQLGDVELNITAQDLDSNEITYWINWFKNNTNQTALAQSGTAQSGDSITLRPDITLPFNVSDKWKARVWVGDGIINSSYYETNETEILNYFNNVSFYTENNTLGGKNKTAFFNATLLGADNITAIFNFNGANYTMINNGTDNNYEFYLNNIKTPYVKNATTFNATWFYRANLENGSYYELNKTINIRLNIVGLFVCNGTVTQTTVNYTFYDSVTNAIISASATILAQMKTDTGELISTTLTQTGSSVKFCITPNNAVEDIEIIETITANGYLPHTMFRENKNYSSNITFYDVYLTNSSKGSIYTFQTQNQYGSAVAGAEVKILQGAIELYKGLTDETGSMLASLVELGIYQISATKDGHVPASFNFIAGAVTLIPISLPTTTSSNITLPDFEEVFKHVQYTLTPTQSYFKTPQNITYTITSDNDILENFGMSIIKDDSIIYKQTSSNNSGGKLVFLVNEHGTYTVNIWFKANGFEKYTPTSYIFTYGASGGVSNAGDLLKTNGVISGFGYYIIAVVIAMMGALWINQYSPPGAIFVGILILCAFTFMWSDAVVITLNETENGKEGVTSLMLTIFATLTSVSIFYLKQYGA